MKRGRGIGEVGPVLKRWLGGSGWCTGSGPAPKQWQGGWRGRPSACPTTAVGGRGGGMLGLVWPQNGGYAAGWGTPGNGNGEVGGGAGTQTVVGRGGVQAWPRSRVGGKGRAGLASKVGGSRKQASVPARTPCLLLLLGSWLVLHQYEVYCRRTRCIGPDVN